MIKIRALLVIDMLRDFIDETGALTVGPEGKEIIPFISDKIDEFRKSKASIIYICDNHESDDKEFDMFKPHCIIGTEGSNIVDELAPAEHDKIIKKRRYSAFFGTELDLYLREREVKELYIVGVCTNICVLYTAADARNLNYDVTIYKEGVASFDKDAHDFALNEAKNTLGCKIV